MSESDETTAQNAEDKEKESAAADIDQSVAMPSEDGFPGDDVAPAEPDPDMDVNDPFGVGGSEDESSKDESSEDGSSKDGPEAEPQTGAGSSTGAVDPPD